MDTVECVVVGAGVVGLAVGRALAAAGREVMVLEADAGIGTGTSSRNSEVIHAGIYYPPGSLKARLCVAGRRALYDYCRARGVDHRRCGKLIVATDPSQLDALRALQARAEANGVEDMALLTGTEAMALEPAVRCVAALRSATSGIIDSHGLMLALEGDIATAGGAVVLAAPVDRVEVATGGTGGFIVQVGGADPCRLRCRLLVNAAGLGAQALAARITGLPARTVPPLHLAKGNYFTLSGRSPVSRLIYPMPEPGGLGVHVTIDLGGQARFGPDVEWVDRVDYMVDPARGDRFYAAIRRYLPDIADGSLQPGYAGIRPKLVAAGGGDADFVIQGPQDHGVDGLCALYGIESPGLTASLAIGALVRDRLLGTEAAIAA